ncbi:uncharacterized protein LOC142976540 [Anticarsia gemmatalis]|uniref:uncharacterized protein LOC142976540 n=1 Tax=Anticarsia gemmatalis TaxID=129554 RepID=UPI003F76511A
MMDVKIFLLTAVVTLLSVQIVSAEIEWVKTTPNATCPLYGRGLVAGYEGYDRSPLWVIRATYDEDLMPGKLALLHNAAYVPYAGREIEVHDIEVLCARPDEVRWLRGRNGKLPRKAFPAGITKNNETLYIGRIKYGRSLTPGKIQPSHEVLYISTEGRERTTSNYEVLCKH